MERAEFYRLWPPPLFMIGITIVQWGIYINHKAYYYKFLGKYLNTTNKIDKPISMFITIKTNPYAYNQSTFYILRNRTSKPYVFGISY